MSNFTGPAQYFPAQFCQPSAGCQRGFTDHPGATRAFRYQNDHDLHAHGEEPDEEGDGQPARFLTRLRATAPPVPVGSRERKVRSVVDGVNSYGGNDTSTRSGLGGASPCRVGQAPSTGSVQVGRPAIPGFSSENNTDAARIVARSEDEASILNVMWRGGMAL